MRTADVNGVYESIDPEFLVCGDCIQPVRKCKCAQRTMPNINISKPDTMRKKIEIRKTIRTVLWCALAMALVYGFMCACKAKDEPPAELVPIVDTITDADFAKVALGNGVHVVDFYSDYCPPCKELAPILDNECAQSKVAAFHRFKCQDGAKADLRYGVDKLPTIIIFKDGHEVARKSGSKIFVNDMAQKLHKWIAECAGAEVAGK